MYIAPSCTNPSVGSSLVSADSGTPTVDESMTLPKPFSSRFPLTTRSGDKIAADVVVVVIIIVIVTVVSVVVVVVGVAAVTPLLRACGREFCKKVRYR